MRISTTARFSVAAALFIVSGWLVLAHSLLPACACLTAVCFLVPRDFLDLSDSAMRRWLWGVGIRLGVLLVMVGIAYFHPFLTPDTAQRIMFHPAFVLPAWLLGLWSIFRRWRRQKEMVGA